MVLINTEIEVPTHVFEYQTSIEIISNEPQPGLFAFLESNMDNRICLCQIDTWEIEDYLSI